MNKLRLWKEHNSFEEAEKEWDQASLEAKKKFPLKVPKSLPSMVGITEDTKKHLKWKSLKWMIKEDQNGAIRSHFLKAPFKYGIAFLKSLLKKKSYLMDGDFFLYGIKNVQEFKDLIVKPNSLLVVGFSYCHKPHECPSGRFTTECQHDRSNPVCQQCYIGKCVHALPEKNVYPLFITTIHYIGEEIFKLVHAHPKKQVHFIITACEMTLAMFGDYGNMTGIKGIGVRLDGRICNTMKAFELSEKGTKPGLTVVLEPTQRRILELLKHLYDTQI